MGGGIDKFGWEEELIKIRRGKKHSNGVITAEYTIYRSQKGRKRERERERERISVVPRFY